MERMWDVGGVFVFFCPTGLWLWLNLMFEFFFA